MTGNHPFEVAFVLLGGRNVSDISVWESLRVRDTIMYVYPMLNHGNQGSCCCQYCHDNTTFYVNVAQKLNHKGRRHPSTERIKALKPLIFVPLVDWHSGWKRCKADRPCFINIVRCIDSHYTFLSAFVHVQNMWLLGSHCSVLLTIQSINWGIFFSFLTLHVNNNNLWLFQGLHVKMYLTAYLRISIFHLDRIY